jgi:uncharacterized protein
MYNRHIRIEYDPAKATGNLRKHRVSFADAAGVLFDPLAVTVADGSAEGESRFVAIGLGNANEPLVVVFTEIVEGRYRLISARRPTRKERKQYEG